MFALVAAVLFVLGAFARGAHWSGTAGDVLLWAMLGLAALCLHFAFAVAVPRFRPPAPPA